VEVAPRVGPVRITTGAIRSAASAGYNTLVAGDNDRDVYMQSAVGDWFQWNIQASTWSDIGFTGDTSLTAGASYAVEDGGVVGWNQLLPALPSEAVKVGIFTAATVTCVLPPGKEPQPLPTVWVMTNQDSDNLFVWTATGDQNCGTGSWENLHQTAKDIADYGSYYLGSDDYVLDANGHVQFKAPGGAQALTEDLAGCVSVIDSNGNVWQEAAVCP
jgi:hypothetical protein